VSSVAHAGQPPQLPPPEEAGPAEEGAPDAADVPVDPTAEPPPAGEGGEAAGDAGGEAAGDAAGDAAAGGDAAAAGDAGMDAGAAEGPAIEGDASMEAGGSLGGDAGTEGAVNMGAAGADASLTDDDPAYVMGRREPMMNTLRGPIGLYYTSLPDVGGNYTFRMRMHTDFFKKKRMFIDHPDFGPDEHARFRGNVMLGFSFLKWFEAYFGVGSSANRNTREDPNRTDPPTVFALGDMDFGLKGAWRGVKGGAVGVGGQIGFGLLSGSERLRTERMNFNFDVLFALDLRYLTAKHAPVRFAINAGWMLDNSYKLTDFGAIDDLNSREVLRFGLGVNNSRVRTRYAIDFPIRAGKERQIGIDPILEYSWDISTRADDEFLELTQAANNDSPLPRTQSWMTIGLRLNPWKGLMLDAAVDVGTVSPNYEYGPPVPPYQIILGLGWSFDPNESTKIVEVPVENQAPPPAVLDGRVIGQIVDASGNPVQAKITFPGLTSNAILTDEAGGFVSYRLPEGLVTVSFELADGTVFEESAEIVPNEDTRLDIQLEGAAPEAAATEGTMDGTFTDDAGTGVKVSVHITGNGIDEPFDSNDAGRIAIALPVGKYAAKVNAEGYLEKSLEFEVVGGETAAISAKLQSEKPPETPNVRGSSRRIRLRKSVRYKGDDVHERSNAILDELATFLTYHPEYEVIEIRVHTDDRGNPKSRSQSRADAVRNYLLSKGVAADRIEAVGRGDKDPVAVNLTPEGRRKNNRTEIRVKQYGK
jgi:outer membrane protein OmpA-like peptidoglycan-associated protein